MAYVEIRTDGTEDNQTPIWNFLEKSVLEGNFIEAKSEVGKNKSMLYSVKLLTTGEVVSFWGSTSLDERMKQIEPNDQIKISYLGEKTSEKSGRKYKVFQVLRDMSDEEAAALKALSGE